MKKETLSISEKEVPKHRNALEEKYQNTQEKEPLNPDNIQDQISQLPMPSGWRLLVLPFTPKEKNKRWNFNCTGIFRQITSGYELWLRSEDGTIGLC